MLKASFNLHVIFTNTDLTSIRTAFGSSLKSTHMQGSSRALREGYTYHGCMPAPPGYRGSHSGLGNYPSHASLMLLRCIDQQLSANTNGWPRNSFRLTWPRTLPFQWRPFMSDSRVRNFLLKWFSYILIPCAPSILVQIVKGFLGCVPFPRNAGQPDRCEPASPKWSHNLFTIPTRWNGKELNTLREHRMCIHLFRSCLSCVSMFFPNML